MIRRGEGERLVALRALWRLRPFMLAHRRALALGLVLLAGVAALELFRPFPIKVVIDDVLGEELQGDVLVLLLAAAAVLFLASALEGLLNYLLVLCLNRAGRQIVLEVRAATFEHVQQLSLRFHARRSSGDLLTRLTADAKALRTVLTESVAELLTSALFLIGMTAVLFVLDWRLALVTLAAAPLVLVVLFRLSRSVREHARAERRREGALATVAHEALGSVRLTRALNREEEVRRRFQAENEASLHSGLSTALAQERLTWASDVMTGFMTAVVLGVGAWRASTGAITIGTLVVFITYIRSFFKPVRTLIKHSAKISRASASIERIVELLDLDDAVADLPGARPAPRLRGAIEFRGVAFAYQEVPVLDGVDLVLPAGRTTALMGPSGAGKTTLASLILRLYDPDAGAVLIDGRDVREFTLASLRAQVSLVHQEPILLAGTVAENIRYARPGASDADVEAAARAAQAHAFISALPDGYATQVGERGDTLSGGQRQRVAIARALLVDAPIVILDEPLAGLDAEAASGVERSLDALTAGRTVLLITHDRGLARRADAVVELIQGRIAAREMHASAALPPAPVPPAPAGAGLGGDRT